MVVIIVLCVIIVAQAIALTLYISNTRYLRGRVTSLEESNVFYDKQAEDACGQYQTLRQQYNKLLNQKKSSEVRTGMIAEQMAPFLSNFPYDPKKASFLGNPIDFVVFDSTGVHFVEVKSGKSQLNSNQKMVRDSIQSGKVTFEIYRIKGE